MKIKWFVLFLLGLTFGCGSDDDNAMPSSVAIMKGVFTVGYDGQVYAMDIESGQKIWTHKIPNGSRGHSSLLAPNGLMYVASIDDFTLYALDANTGEEKWKFVSEDYGFFYPHLASDKSTLFVGGWDDKVHALDALTGKQKWVSSAAKGDIKFIKEQNGIVYFTSDDKTLYAVDATSGAMIWKLQEPTGESFKGLSVTASGVYVTARKGVYAVDLLNGKQKYFFSPAGIEKAESYPVIKGESLYEIIINTDGQNYLYSVNISSGIQEWKLELPDDSYLTCPYVSDDDMVYLKGNSGNFVAVSAKTGKQIWVNKISIGGYASPVVVGKTIFVNDVSQYSPQTNGVYALDAINGEIKWRFSTQVEGVETISVVSGAKIYNSSLLE